MQTCFSNLNAVCQLNEKKLDVYRTDEQDDDEEDMWDPENQPTIIHKNNETK